MADEDEVVEDVATPPTLMEAVASYRQHVPMLQMVVAQTRIELKEQLETIQDVRMRDMFKKQLLMWDVSAAQLGAVPMILQMLAELYAAMGCDVERRDH